MKPKPGPRRSGVQPIGELKPLPPRSSSLPPKTDAAARIEHMLADPQADLRAELSHLLRYRPLPRATYRVLCWRPLDGQHQREFTYLEDARAFCDALNAETEQRIGALLWDARDLDEIGERSGADGRT